METAKVRVPSGDLLQWIIAVFFVFSVLVCLERCVYQAIPSIGVLFLLPCPIVMRVSSMDYVWGGPSGRQHDMRE